MTCKLCTPPHGDRGLCPSCEMQDAPCDGSAVVELPSRTDAGSGASAASHALWAPLPRCCPGHLPVCCLMEAFSPSQGSCPPLPPSISWLGKAIAKKMEWLVLDALWGRPLTLAGGSCSCSYFNSVA